MSDLEWFGNLALLLTGSGSLAVWYRLALSVWLREPLLPFRPRESNSWPQGAAVRTFLAAFLVQWIVMISASYLLRETSLAKSTQLILMLCTSVVVQVLTVVLLLSVETDGQLRAADFGLSLTQWKDDLRTGALGFLASLLPVYAVNLLIHLLGWHPPGQQHELLKILQEKHAGFALAGTILSATLLAPIAEELLYRVVLQGGLEDRLPGNLAIWATAILFAGVHSLSGRPDALPLFPLALVLGYVYRQTHSYLAVVTLHALFNGFSVLMALVGRGS